MGRRLGELTKDNTKCMLEVNGTRLIDRTLESIAPLGLKQIVLVVGYNGEKVKQHLGDNYRGTKIVYVDNPIYDITNNIYSLYLAREYMVQDDTLLLESDLIFESSIIDKIVADPRPDLALVDKYESWMDGTVVTLDEEQNIVQFINKEKFRYSDISSYYKTVNIYKFSYDFSKLQYVPFLEAYCTALGRNEYYEQVLRVITLLGDTTLKALPLDGEKWYEIDDVQDLDIAQGMFAPTDEDQWLAVAIRYGGYWRYPHLTDYCYLVNPYFPPRRMMDEIRASFDTLVTEYPSGMRVNSLLAAKNFGVRQENILVGNGAAELIKSLMGRLDGKVGFVRPTFDEYPNRYARADSVDFTPDNPDYSYTAEDLMGFFGDKGVRSLVVVNPDNPSGNYMPRADVLRLVRWARERELRIVVDESFVDFADEADATLIEQATLDENPHLYVMKSISKSYGVPGLRLGVLASGDTGAIVAMKKDVAIWNINSLAEFYMQIEEKYRGDYAEALARLRAERTRFQDELSTIEGVRVIPSQANYVMVELEEGIDPRGLLRALLVRHEILIKELTTKTNGRNYLRLAVRNAADNDRLVAALREELE